MAGITKRDGVRCTYYTGTAEDLIAAGRVRRNQFPPEGRAHIAFMQGAQVDGRCTPDETYIRVEILKDGNVKVQHGLPREEQRKRRSEAVREAHREIREQRARRSAERAAEEAKKRKEAADQARHDLKNLIAREEDFRRMVVAEVRKWMRVAIGWFDGPRDDHAFTMSDESIEDIRMSVDAVVEAVMHADVRFDAAKHQRIVKGYEATIRAADPSFYAKLDKLVEPNPSILEGEAS